MISDHNQHFKIINEIFGGFLFVCFFGTNSEIWSVFYTQSTSQFRLATIQVLNSLTWLVATIIVDSTAVK